MISHCKLGSVLLLGLFLASCSPQPTKQVSPEAQKGQKIFHQVCANCHGPDAMGDHTKAPKLIDVEFLAPNFSDDEIRETIVKGINKMPSQRSKVSDEEIDEIIKYLRFSQNAAGLAVEDEPEEDEGMVFEEETTEDTAS